MNVNFALNEAATNEENSRLLVECMRRFSKSVGLPSGCFFDYGDNETARHTRWCQAARTSAYFMVEAARNSGQAIRVFKNMLGTVTAAID